MILRIISSIITGLIFLLPSLGFGQISEDFSDGNFTNNPKWIGDDSLFRVNPSFELQLNDTNAISNNSSYLSAASKSIKNANWEFKFNLGFQPSGSNYARFYLVADQGNFASSINGYYVKIGGQSGTVDDISLYKQSGSTSTLLIDGRDGVAASNPAGWIKVTRDSVGNWELLSDTSSSHAGYVSEGTVSNSDFISSQYSGVFCKYTSTRKYLFSFDSIKVTGLFYSDTTKPFVVNYDVLDSNRIKIKFSENINPILGLDANNYEVLDNSGMSYQDSLIQFDGLDSSSVHYYLKGSLGRTPVHILNVKNAEDVAGNKMNNWLSKFVWPVFYTAKKGDIIINEIMADPNPPVALPNADWVEIYNNSKKAYNLKNWEFSDRSSTGQVKLPETTLNPGEYAVLCHQSDSADLAAFGIRVIALKSFPGLNISDDLLTLKDSSDNSIDRVEYFASWYGDPAKSVGGFTFELINPDHSCSGSSNWKGSTSLDGGTPGKQNSVYNKAPETDKPEVVSVKITGPNLLTVQFTKPLDSASLLSGKYTVTNGLSIIGNTILIQPSVFIDLTLSGPPLPGTVYYLKIENVGDCFGNLIKENNSVFGIGANPNALDLVINEIFPNPDDSKTTVSSYEYVEIHNRTSKLISLDSCLFLDKSTSVSLQGGLIEAGGKIVICEKNAETQLSKYGNVLGLSSWPSLNNSGDLLSLTTTANELIHLVDYSDSWYANDNKKAGGWSLELIDSDNPCAGAENWRASINEKGGTPNADNSIKTLNPSKAGPNLLRANAIGDSSVLLSFDQTVVFSDLNVLIFKFSNALISKKVKVSGTNELLVDLNGTLINRIIYTIEVAGLVNCSGLPIEKNSAQFGLPEIGEIGDIIINEILFDPYSTAKSDYVELYNRSDKIIDLKNWVLCEFDETKDTLDGCKFITSSSYSLLPKSFVLISKDNSDIIKHYATNDESRFLEIETMPTFSNDEGIVVVINDSLEIVDQLHYNSDWHHVLIKDPNGISLERLDYNRETQNKDNWHSAAKTVGYGTPGLLNSQYFAASDFSQNIVIEPETFSPDNDGFEDVLNINYSFETAGNVANVIIYDAEGRQIIQLANNELLAIQGTITWDGSTEDNTKARSGLYIISFEIHNEKGSTSQFKKTCILAIKF